MWPRLLAAPALLLCCSLAVPLPAWAQRLQDGSRKFDDASRIPLKLARKLINDKDGKDVFDAKDKSHTEAIDYAAKAIIFPLYWNADTEKRGQLYAAYEDLDTHLSRMARNKTASAAMAELYCKKIMVHAAEVLTKSKAITAVNVTRLLARIPERQLERGIFQPEKEWIEEVSPRLTNGNGDALCKQLTGIITDKKINDGARYFALRGLVSLLSLPDTASGVKKETSDKAFLAAKAIVDTSRKFPVATQQGVIEGFKVLRGQAVKVLAQSKAPLLGDKDQLALSLAKVAANDSRVAPPPRLEERIEAAIGLANLAGSVTKFANYQPDYAAQTIGYAVRDFGLAANKNIEKKLIERQRMWKIDAARLIEALDAMNTVTKDKHVKEVVTQCKAVLKSIEDGKQCEVADLGDWLSKTPPAATALFKADSTSTIKLSTPGKDDKEPKKDDKKPKKDDKNPKKDGKKK